MIIYTLTFRYEEHVTDNKRTFLIIFDYFFFLIQITF